MGPGWCGSPSEPRSPTAGVRSCTVSCLQPCPDGRVPNPGTEIVQARTQVHVDVSTSPSALPLHDVTARKVHQWAMVALVVIAFVVEGVPAAALLALAGLVMLAGRFWWPADLFRQLTWRVLEPAGILPRRDVHEDHETRRVARVIGGVAWRPAPAPLRPWGAR